MAGPHTCSAHSLATGKSKWKPSVVKRKEKRLGVGGVTSRRAQHGRAFTMGMHRFTLVARTLTQAQTLSKIE